MSEEERNPNGDLNVHLTASRDELSLKAKGAGVLILLVITLSGIVFMGYLMATLEDKSYTLIWPLIFLVYISHSLIGTLDALLGITSRPRSDD